MYVKLVKYRGYNIFYKKIEILYILSGSFVYIYCHLHNMFSTYLKLVNDCVLIFIKQEQQLSNNPILLEEFFTKILDIFIKFFKENNLSTLEQYVWFYNTYMLFNAQLQECCDMLDKVFQPYEHKKLTYESTQLSIKCFLIENIFTQFKTTKFNECIHFCVQPNKFSTIVVLKHNWFYKVIFIDIHGNQTECNLIDALSQLTELFAI